MNTRYFMSTSSVVLVLTGGAFLFLPAEVLALMQADAGKAPEILLQMLSGGMIGLGYVDWMTRGSLIGGIYGRPVLVGNQVCCTVAALVLVRASFEAYAGPLIWACTLLYVPLAVGFSVLFYKTPSAPES